MKREMIRKTGGNRDEGKSKLNDYLFYADKTLYDVYIQCNHTDVCYVRTSSEY